MQGYRVVFGFFSGLMRECYRQFCQVGRLEGRRLRAFRNAKRQQLMLVFVASLSMSFGCSAENNDVKTDSQSKSQQASSAPFEEGVHYKRLPSPEPGTGDTVEVLEFFSYGCPHCNSLEPVITKWKKKKPASIEFEAMPAHWNEFFRLLAHAFYTSKLLNVHDVMHRALFDALHAQRRPIRTEQAIRALFVENGVDGKAFDKTFNSFAVNQKVKMAESLFHKFKLTSVPVFIVDRTYMTDVRMAGGRNELTKVIDHLSRETLRDRK